MTTDPFKNFKPLNLKPRAKTNPNSRKTDSFVESMRDMGSSVMSSLKNDVIKGTAQSIFDQLLGSTKSGQAPDLKAPDQSLFEEMVKGREQEAAEEAKLKERAFHQHKSQESQVLFSFADEKVRKEIEGVRQELSMLVASMGKVEMQIEQAIMDNVVDAGVYHLNYFRKLKEWIAFMRKSLSDGSAWLQATGSRKNRGYYWQQVGKSGSKYSLSSERNVQMGAG